MPRMWLWRYRSGVDLAVVVSVGAALVAAASAWYARIQANAAKDSADAAGQMANLDAERRHEEVAPLWDSPKIESVGNNVLGVVILLRDNHLDRLLIEIVDSPGILLDETSQVLMQDDRLTVDRDMYPGDTITCWVRVTAGHHRRCRLRLTAALNDKWWRPVVLDTSPITLEYQNEQEF
ncbi:hypothetical protein ATK86_7212 [Nocardia fluminea]|uniref:Uncharacterized protein n=1 Tax=Nocardia fluminea TaxID=134984 RepID=A0A2N3V5A5_9NOCA|nr:hypothetical protein ATK86_7212 [Nocardia fluminea]